MEKPTLPEIKGASFGETLGTEERELGTAESPWGKVLVSALAGLTLNGCVTVHTAGGSVTSSSYDGGKTNRTQLEWTDTEHRGDWQRMCRQIANALRAGGEQHVTGTHEYEEGMYELRGVKLPDGRVATFEVVGPNGKVYSCK